MKKILTYVSTLALAFALLLPQIGMAQEQQNQDQIAGFTLSSIQVESTTPLLYDAENPYAKAIEYLQKKGVIKGYVNNKFQEDRPITRAEFIKMMIKNTHETTVSLQTFSHPYQDVQNDLWYAPYVQEAWELGILEDGTLFEPGATLTRVEATEWVLKLLGRPLPRVIKKEVWPLDFKDVKPRNPFASAVLYGMQAHIIAPLEPEKKYFRPLRKLTRGEAANLIYRADIYVLGTQILDGSAELQGQIQELGLADPIPHLDLLADVWNRLKLRFYDPEIHDQAVSNLEQLTYGAIKGMVEELGDEYSVFLEPVESAAFEGTLQGTFGGIGAEVEEEPAGVIRIKNFLIGAPAESSGLRVNDRIVMVDGQDVRGKSAGEVVSFIRGEIDTIVNITVEREGAPQTLTYPITRDKITLDYLQAKMIDNAIYVDINLFTQLAFIDFNDEVRPLVEANPQATGFILDLRDNPGGFLDSAKIILGHFIRNGQSLLYVKTAKDHVQLHLSTGEGEWKDSPIVILINGESASASEIVAMTLKEKARAILVGETTFGKGTVQEIVNYTDGSSLKLTIAEWLSPKFKSINGIGLDPHAVVPFTDEDRAAGKDPQLGKALEVLKKEAEQRALAEENS